MISYEFSRSAPADDYLYLRRALGILYGEEQEADPMTVKALMDMINPNRYLLDQIREVLAWETEDGTFIYQYYYAGDNFALTYVSPLLGKEIYQTNGL
jgi:hypothetical protein